MSFDEEYIDPHGECAAEIAKLKSERDSTQASLLRVMEGVREIQRRSADALEDFEKGDFAWDFAADIHQLVCLAVSSGEAIQNDAASTALSPHTEK